jgi:hypothetical protein
MFDVSSTDVGYTHSKITEGSDMHSAKQLSLKNLSDAGIATSINPVFQNACFSVRDNLDPCSNVTDESNPHKGKYTWPKTSIDAGITMSINPV